MLLPPLGVPLRSGLPISAVLHNELSPTQPTGRQDIACRLAVAPLRPTASVGMRLNQRAARALHRLVLPLLHLLLLLLGRRLDPAVVLLEAIASDVASGLWILDDGYSGTAQRVTLDQQLQQRQRQQLPPKPPWHKQTRRKQKNYRRH